MLLQRAILRIFAPHRLNGIDDRLICWAIDNARRRVERGSLIGYYGDIPERDLVRRLVVLEQLGYIERAPGPFDAPYTSDPLRSWWCPGRNWAPFAELHGANP